jgi:hypothetical protein
LVSDWEQVKVWLAEYDAAIQTRNHYDSTRWLIGSIFIAIIFTMFAASFQPLVMSIFSISVLAGVSLILWCVFVYYDQHVQPWIKAALFRCRMIEGYLQSKGYDYRLQSYIGYEYDRSGNLIRKRNQVGAIWVVVLFSIMIPLMWIARFLLR